MDILEVDKYEVCSSDLDSSLPSSGLEFDAKKSKVCFFDLLGLSLGDSLDIYNGVELGTLFLVR